jgi:hypothetical protein
MHAVCVCVHEHVCAVARKNGTAAESERHVMTAIKLAVLQVSMLY